MLHPETLTCGSPSLLNPAWKLLLVPLSRGEHGGPEVGGPWWVTTQLGTGRAGFKSRSTLPLATEPPRLFKALSEGQVTAHSLTN